MPYFYIPDGIVSNPTKPSFDQCITGFTICLIALICSTSNLGTIFKYFKLDKNDSLSGLCNSRVTYITFPGKPFEFKVPSFLETNNVLDGL